MLENIILASDLNVILNQVDKRGGYLVRDPIREHVDDLILDWELNDVIPSKGKFTWTNKRLELGHISARLDRFLIQDSFLLLGVNITSKITPFEGSDHNPITLEITIEHNLGPIPFRFSPLWTSHKYFMGLVAEIWSVLVSGSTFYVWEEKLRRLKKYLKLWAKSISSPTQNKSKALLSLEAHQLAMETFSITKEVIEKELSLHHNV